MSLWNLVTNTVEGVAQTAAGTARLAASPVTQWVKEDEVEDAVKTTEQGIKKIGKSD